METRTEMDRRPGPDLSVTDGPDASRMVEARPAGTAESNRTPSQSRHASTPPRVSLDPMRSTDRYQLAQPTDLGF